VGKQITLSEDAIDRKIAELRRELDWWELAKERLILMDTPAITTEETVSKVRLESQPAVAQNTSPGPYAGMGAKVAAIKYLRDAGSPQKLTVMAKALLKGGVKTDSKLFHRTLFNTLTIASKRKHSEIVHIGMLWGLKEWGLTENREN
jgi:hypothetical protein